MITETPHRVQIYAENLALQAPANNDLCLRPQTPIQNKGEGHPRAKSDLFSSTSRFRANDVRDTFKDILFRNAKRPK